MDRHELIKHLNFLISLAGSQKNLAQIAGFSEAYLSDVLNGRREPGKKLLDAIGVREIVTYEFAPSPPQWMTAA